MSERRSPPAERRGDPPADVPERALEAIKLRYDMFKHLTTMCSGAILLTLSVVAGLFPKPHAAFLLAASILCFLMGAVASALAMRNIVHDLDEADDRLHRSKAQLFAWSTLYSGLAIFAVFALINFIKR